MTILHQHSDTTLKYCSHVIYESDYKLGSLWWKIGASLIRYRINKSSKPLYKSINLHLQKFNGKSQKPLLNQKNISSCLTFSLLHCSHVTYLNHQDISNQSNELVCHRLSLSCLLYFCVHLPAYISCLLSSQKAPLVAAGLKKENFTNWNVLLNNNKSL